MRKINQQTEWKKNQEHIEKIKINIYAQKRKRIQYDINDIYPQPQKHYPPHSITNDFSKRNARHITVFSKKMQLKHPDEMKHIVS